MKYGERGNTSFVSCSDDSAPELPATRLSGHHVETRFHCRYKLLTIVRRPIFHQCVGSLLDSSNGQPPARILEDEDDLIKFGRGVEFHYTVPHGNTAFEHV